MSFKDAIRDSAWSFGTDIDVVNSEKWIPISHTINICMIDTHLNVSMQATSNQWDGMAWNDFPIIHSAVIIIILIIIHHDWWSQLELASSVSPYGYFVVGIQRSPMIPSLEACNVHFWWCLYHSHENKLLNEQSCLLWFETPWRHSII